MSIRMLPSVARREFGSPIQQLRVCGTIVADQAGGLAGPITANPLNLFA
jgi:hypothetical protein